MYGAADPALPRRCPPLTPRSLAAQALPPVLPPRRLVDRFLYDLFLLLFVLGALALEDVVFDAVVFLRLLVVGLDVVVSVVIDNPGKEVALLFLLPPDFLFVLVVVVVVSSPFFFANLTPFTPVPDPPLKSFRPFMHA